jgi:hypothetical protein
VISPLQGLYLHTGQHKHRINVRAYTQKTRVGFKPTIPASKQAKTVHALDRSPTVIGLKFGSPCKKLVYMAQIFLTATALDIFYMVNI